MKYLLIAIVLVAYLFIAHAATRDYNARVCSVYGYESDCQTVRGSK